jgi:hypothetical protein
MKCSRSYLLTKRKMVHKNTKEFRYTDSILDILKIQNQKISSCSRIYFIINGIEFDCTLRGFSFKLSCEYHTNVRTQFSNYSFISFI